MSRHLKKYFFILLILAQVQITAGFTQDPDHTVKIPMRDGTELITDIYLPAEKEKQYPCILLRTPAGRAIHPWKNYSALSHLGYVVAIQDTRSGGDPEGKTFPYFHDGWGQYQDGYDTVEWLSKSSWVNGKVGTIGVSAAGITQLMMAASAPPSLVCQYIGFAASNMYAHAIYPGGQMLKNQVEGWLGRHAQDKSVLEFVLKHPTYDDFWEHFNSLKVSHQTKAPGFLYTGWYDTFLQGTIDAFMARQNQGGEGAKNKQKLLIGPWGHYFPISMAFGDYEVPKEGQTFPDSMSPQKWFDFHLKGKNTGIDELPAVNYFVMGPFEKLADGSTVGNIWRTADRWPVPAELRAFYLSTKQQLLAQTDEISGEISFQHDPLNPVPTLGGRNLFLESGPKDQRSIESRSDVILFTTPPLENELEVTGPILAKLLISSDCKDSDIVLRLTDLYPDGRSILLSDGIYRTGSHLQSEDGKHEITVDLWSASFVIAKGHALRLSISGSNYPRYEINQTTGLTANSEGHKVACNTVHVGKEGSRLILPVTREGGL